MQHEPGTSPGSPPYSWTWASSRTVKFLIRDRGPDYTATFDAVLADAGSGPCCATSGRPR